MGDPAIRPSFAHSGRRTSRRAPVALCLIALAALACAPAAGPPTAEPPGAHRPPGPSEPPDRERYRAFLRFYAPLLLKQAHEPPGLAGRDWITNFFFDDERLANNRVQWVEELPGFVQGDGDLDWEIRPTLYTHAIEFAEGEERSMILVYHVYHAMQALGIHDWERVELRVDGVGERPGRGERVRFVVITQHSAHRARGPEEVHWLENESGKHVLVWQAPWANSWDAVFLSALPWKGLGAKPRKAELRFVDEGWDPIRGLLASDDPVRVAVAGSLEPYPVHYLFVPDTNPAATAALGAHAITRDNAASLNAGRTLREALPGAAVRRVCYELQDTADILPTHWDRRREGVQNADWAPPAVHILMDTALRDEDDGVAVPGGLQAFLTTSIDDAGSLKKRRGYPAKHWFWGAYHFGRVGNFRADAFRLGAPQRTRAEANTCADCLGEYWHQHDFFAHTGESARGGQERGRWLARGWHRADRGGFDGRWVQLFDDEARPSCPE